MERWCDWLRHWLAREVAPPHSDEHDDEIALRQDEMATTLAALQARADLIQGRLQRHINKERRSGTH